MENMNPLPISNPKLFCVEIDEFLSRAYDIMNSNRVRHLVVTRDRMAIGVLSNRDVMKALHIQVHDLYGTRVREESFSPDTRVGDVMGWPVETLAASASIPTMVDLMLEKKLSSLLLTQDDGSVCEIVTTDDMLRVLKTILSQQSTEQTHHSSALDNFLARLYNSPVGRIVDELSNTGI